MTLLGDSAGNLYSDGGSNTALLLLTRMLITFLCIQVYGCLIVVFIVIILDIRIIFVNLALPEGGDIRGH